jgi:phosphatidylinositol glycan class T
MITSTALDASDISIVPLSVQRTLQGSSQARGRLAITITNNWPTQMQAIYLETMPWLLQFYLHTLQVHYKGASRGTFISLLRCLLSDNIFLSMQMT